MTRAKGSIVLPVLTDGCIHHSSCFTCPFPDCIIEDRITEKPGTTKSRIELLRASGMTVQQVAAHLHLSKRQVYRYLA